MENPRTKASKSAVRSLLPGTTISALPPDLLGKIFESIPDENRCAVVPRVCRAWHDVHRSHPPRRSWMVLTHPITPGKVRWCSSGVTATLKQLSLTNHPAGRDAGLLYQLLPLVASTAPMLEKLEVSDHHGEESRGKLLGCLALFSRLEDLRIRRLMCDWLDAAYLQHFTGLVSLKDLELFEMSADVVSEHQTAELWGALATLQHLSSLSVSLSHSYTMGHPRDYPEVPKMPFFFEHLPSLKHLRDLQLGEVAGTYVGGAGYVGGFPGILHKSFSCLTQLTSLWLEDSLPIKSLQPILGLPLLESVIIKVHRSRDQSSTLNWQSRHLSYLRIDVEKGPLPMSLDYQKSQQNVCLQMSRLLPATVPALPQLQILGIEDAGLQEFPDVMAAGLSSLRELNLSGNAFTRLPSGLSRLSGLEKFCMAGNNHLQLEKQDLDTLGKLPKLEIFDVTKELEDRDDQLWTDFEPEPLWSETSRRVLHAFTSRFPHVRLIFGGRGLYLPDELDEMHYLRQALQ